MAERYPVVEPDASGMLNVTDGYALYWEIVGDPAGAPAVYLHGGPGSGSTPGARGYFDPDRFRAVLFDQRGCGRSRPLARRPGVDLSTNTTAHLVEDLERLREHLGIERWVVVGVSWGVTLGLVYAQAHPERVRAMCSPRSPPAPAARRSGSPAIWGGCFRASGTSSPPRCPPPSGTGMQRVGIDRDVEPHLRRLVRMVNRKGLGLVQKAVQLGGRDLVVVCHGYIMLHYRSRW